MLPTLKVTGGNTAWRVWLGSELVATFPTLTEAWLAVKAANKATEQFA